MLIYHILQDLKNLSIIKLSIVHCPPVTNAIIKRPDPKYQLGFSVEDGIVSWCLLLFYDTMFVKPYWVFDILSTWFLQQICSLMRGGIAERGGIRVGHRIIEINGQSVVATPHEKIIQILSNAVGEVRGLYFAWKILHTLYYVKNYFKTTWN